MHWQAFARMQASNDAHVNQALNGMAAKLGILKRKIGAEFMKTFFKWTIGAIALFFAYIWYESSNELTQKTLAILGVIIGYGYFISKQIDENQKKTDKALQTIYDAINPPHRFDE